MGSVGLSFGSPTSGQGFDVTATVNQIVTNLQGTETPYKTQLATLQSEDTALSSLGGLLSTLSNDISALTDPTGVLDTKEGASSNTNALVLTNAASTAVAGSHTVTVSQLAQTSMVYSQAMSGTDALSGSISIQVGNGAAQVVNVDPQNNKLSGLAASINQAGIGVTANVITDSSGSRLSLVSGTSGAGGNLQVDASQLTDTTQATSPIFSVAQTGQDAQLVVDGIALSSASNTVSNVIPGVTFQLLDTSSSPIQVQVTNDAATVAQSLAAFVKDYNAVVSAMDAQEGNNSSGQAQPLFGSPVLSGLQQQLASVLVTPAGSGTISGISALGISIQKDGTLALNSDTLNSALESNYTDVQNFFQAAGGFGLAMSAAVDASGAESPTGMIATAMKQNASIEGSLNDTLTRLDSTIAAQKTSLTAQLNAANQTLQFIPMQVNEVNELYSAISGYQQQKG